MRKFILIVLSFLLVLSFTGIASALHIPELPEGETVVVAKGASDLTIGGRILVRGWYFQDVSFAPAYLPVDAPSTALYSTNAYLFVDAKITDNLQGFMELETMNNDIGTSGLYVWGTHDEKPVADLTFRQLWIQYTGSGLLGVPAGLKVGHQLITLGEKQFLNHERFGDDAIIVFVNPTKELHLAAVTAKLDEDGALVPGVPGRQAFVGNSNDLDLYTILGTYKLDKDNTLGINYSYINESNLDLQFSNIGLHANGLLFGALTYAAEFDYQFGEVLDPGIDYGGWGVMAKLGYKIDPINIRASFAMGSGDDELGDDEIEEFQVTMGNNDVSPLARFVHYTQIYERTIRTSSLIQTLDAGTVRNTGIANTTYYNLGADVMLTKDLTLSLDGFIIQATETPDDVDDSVGTELDFKGSYKLARNLTYFVEAGAFWAGDFYDDAFGIDSETVTQVIHGINLTF